MKLSLKLVALATLAVPSLGFALGIRIADQNAEATARGDAFVATADNPSAVYYNPAGISQLQGQNLLLGGYAIYLQDKVTPPSYDSVRTKDKIEGIPQFFYTYSIKDSPVTLGLGLYSPYGFGLAYPDTNPFRLFALKGSVEYLTLNPVISYKINKTLSVAAGMTLNYADAELAQGVLPFPGNTFDFKGHGFAVGYNLGILWQPTEQHSFGISYHSRTSMNLHGTSTLAYPGTYFQQAAVANEFKFADFLTAGYSFRPTPAWNFEADVDWTNWHDLKSVTLNQQVSPSVPLNFNWQSSCFYEFGATRYFENGYHISAGYIYSQNSVPTGSSFNPLIPDSARDIFTTGFGWKKDRLSWDFAYELSYGAPRTIIGAPTVGGESVNGEYRFISHALTLSFGYNF